MTKKFFLFAVIAAAMVLMTSCMKTEASVDVQVMKNGAGVSGVTVYKFNNNLGEGTTQYKTNAERSAKTNAAGVAHFDLKSPDDFAPSSLGVEESNTFYFATFDAEDRRNGFVAVTIRTGEKKTVTIEME
ncbi:MAG: hypothetical protein IKN59_06105 [Paludibacteraceae bacterium]|nr:hypothetical protein [Paludibacteraceae bacterium]